MERWENRYTHARSRGARAAEHSRLDRVKSILIILMAVALLGVGIAGVQAIRFRGEAADRMIARAVTECGEAVSQVASLSSRTGGSETPSELSRIRGNVNAVNALNSTYRALYGRELVPQSAIDGLNTVIDNYFIKLKNGSSPTEEIANLADGLAALQSLLTAAQ